MHSDLIRLLILHGSTAQKLSTTTLAWNCGLKVPQLSNKLSPCKSYHSLIKPPHAWVHQKRARGNYYCSKASELEIFYSSVMSPTIVKFCLHVHINKIKGVSPIPEVLLQKD
jgi:hypothetical protein